MSTKLEEVELVKETEVEVEFGEFVALVQSQDDTAAASPPVVPLRRRFVLFLLVTTCFFLVDYSIIKFNSKEDLKGDPSLASVHGTLCGEDRLYLNEERLQSWQKAGLPVLTTAMQNPDTQETYLIFRYILDKYFEQDKKIDLKYNFLDAYWSCNGMKASEPYPAPQYKAQRLDFFHCQVHGHPAGRILEQTTELVLSTVQADDRKTLLHHVVLSTMIKGSEPQAYLPQWIEYHRHAFGIQHFFVYVNEPWRNFRDQPSYKEWDFVTYIPFPLGYHDDAFYYQRLQQNDMFWRIKHLSVPSSAARFGSQIQWVGMMDIDEYLYAPALNASSADSTYRKYLKNLLEEHSNGPAVSFHNTFYGGPGAQNFEWNNANGTARDILLCRFVHRQEPYVVHKKWQRQKFFARVDAAVYMNVHMVHSWTGSSDPKKRYTDTAIYLDATTELRHNHFKLSGAGEAEIVDTRFRDTFCEMMHEVLDRT
eukprot:scaffold591_cov176-Amphora_coffeaeformis.AAC.2